MKRKAIKSALETLEKNLEKVTGLALAKGINSLINIVESLLEENENQAKKIQTLNDEINQLKGENGQPTIRKQSRSSNDKDNQHSSEKERKQRASKLPRKPGGTRKAKVIPDRIKVLTIDKSTLPAGAHRNGNVSTVVQEIHFGTDNIQFDRETYYDKSTQQHFIAPLPDGYDSEYGPKIKAWIKTACSQWNMTIKHMTSMVTGMGIQISSTTVSRMALNDNKSFHQEKNDIIKAGILSTSYQHLDDTSGREKGQNCYVNVLANPYYTAYFTLRHKDRLSVIDMLSVDGLRFILNKEALLLMECMGLAQCHLTHLENHLTTKTLLRVDMDTLLNEWFANPDKHKAVRKIISEACAITSYQSSSYPIQHLIVDDAPQFKSITQHLGLCWIHEGRHYKKMQPIINQHVLLLEEFREQFWDYYQQLMGYKDSPSPANAALLATRFDELFSQTTGYEKLDKQLALTRAKKEALLLVLKFPFIPIHNNSAELAARVQARNRDIHLHTMSKEGTKTKDTLATLSETASKLMINMYDYVLDRITKRYSMPSLADVIRQRSSVMLE